MLSTTGMALVELSPAAIGDRMSNHVVITGVDLSFDDAAKLSFQFFAASCLFGIIVSVALMLVGFCLVALLVSQGITHLPPIR